jgi:hypothetical protein
MDPHRNHGVLHTDSGPDTGIHERLTIVYTHNLLNTDQLTKKKNPIITIFGDINFKVEQNRKILNLYSFNQLR